MRGISRREFGKAAAGAPLIGCQNMLTATAVQANPAWEPWRELLNFLPAAESLAAAREARKRAPLVFTVQRIETAKKPLVNLDRYEVRITKFPTTGPAAGGAEAFYRHVQHRFNDFLQQDLASFGPHLVPDETEWNTAGTPPLGCMMVFSIKNYGSFGLERGAVVVSASGPMMWRFSTVTIGSLIIGTHPVAGNREFGLRSETGGSYVFYTQAADRAFDLLPPEDFVLNGAKALWRAFQTKLQLYVDANGGQAAVLPPIVQQPTFEAVRAAGVFNRA